MESLKEAPQCGSLVQWIRETDDLRAVARTRGRLIEAVRMCDHRLTSHVTDPRDWRTRFDRTLDVVISLILIAIGAVAVMSLASFLFSEGGW